jgi:hypothetical protein
MLQAVVMKVCSTEVTTCRSLEGAWTITVTIEQTPTSIGGKFVDEIMAARAHDLLVLLFCSGRAARRVNFQAWTFADELPAYKNLSLVRSSKPSSGLMIWGRDMI